MRIIGLVWLMRDDDTRCFQWRVHAACRTAQFSERQSVSAFLGASEHKDENIFVV